MREIRANIGRINHLNELTDSQAREVNESIRGSALGRIMSEFGLNDRNLKSAFRDKNAIIGALNQGLYSEQMKGA